MSSERKRLRAEYLRACRNAHPDKEGGSVEKFTKIQEEYRVALKRLGEEGDDASDESDPLTVIVLGIASAFSTLWSERGCFVAHKECKRPTVRKCQHRSNKKSKRKAIEEGGGPADYCCASAMTVFHRCIRGTDDATAQHFPDAISLAHALVACLPSSVYTVARSFRVVEPGFININLAHRALASIAHHRGDHYRVRSPDSFQCPICGGMYKKERGIRLHLQSPRHGLAGEALLKAVEAAKQRHLIMNTYRGVTGATARPSSDATKSDEKRVRSRRVETATLSGNLDPGLIAARDGHLDTLRTLVEGGFDFASTFDRHGSCALHYAAGSGHLDIVKYLVCDLGDDVNRRAVIGRVDGRTALHWACRNGRLQTAKWLVANGATYAPTIDGTTPFHWASWQGQREVCRWIVDAFGVAVARAQNKYKCNALHWVALAGDVEMFAFIASFGVDPNVPNAQGHTSVHKAAWRGNMSLLLYLRDETRLDSAAFGVLDRNGYAPADLARLGGYPDVQRWLEHEAGKKGGSDASSDTKSDAVVSGTFEWVCDVDRILKYLAPEHLAPKMEASKVRIVDVGCGTSAAASKLAQMYGSVTGVDINEDVIDCMRRRYSKVRNLRFVRGDMTTTDSRVLNDGQYDVIFDKSTLDAMMCHSSRVDYVQNVLRALRVGGAFVTVSFYPPKFIVPFLSSPGGSFESKVKHIAIREEEVRSCDSISTYVYVARKSTVGHERRETLNAHQQRILDQYMQEFHSMLTPDRLAKIKRSLFPESTRSLVSAPDVYAALFTLAEKESYPYDDFLGDLKSFEGGRLCVNSEQADGNSLMMGLSDIIQFIRVMQ